ncbi:MAG: response regulator [Deltaproteobacteria bacterium]|nr:response regulator [Deltaproteobacteria bacterium]
MGPAPAHSCRVLLVDDEEPLLRAWTRELHRLGVEAWTARSGRDAESVLARFPGHFDAVACDLHMPDGSGMEFYRFLVTEYPGVEHRVVFVTGGAISDTETEFLRTAGNPVLEKPCELGPLVKLAREWAGRRLTRGANAGEDRRR